MKAQELIDSARTLVAGDKGLLAIDESNSTCNERFARLGIPQTEEARRAYRELIVTTPGLGDCISGMILYDKTIRQQKKDGTPFVKVITEAGIIPGIKVDTGEENMAGHPNCRPRGQSISHRGPTADPDCLEISVEPADTQPKDMGVKENVEVGFIAARREFVEPGE
jgi:fructose-bisphosphate aldolase class 1